MVTTHLTRAGSEALRIKLDLEAALLSCNGQDQMRTLSTGTLQSLKSRLSLIVSRNKDPHCARLVLHGYIFDAWSSRKCPDEFLELNIPWTLPTEAYIGLISDLRLQDELLATLLTVTRKHAVGFMGLLVACSKVSPSLIEDLFLWSADRIRSEKDTGIQLSTLWLGWIRGHEHCRRIFLGSFKSILSRLTFWMVQDLKHTLQAYDSSIVFSDDQKEQESSRKEAFQIIHDLVADITLTLRDTSDSSNSDLSGSKEIAQSWDKLFPCQIRNLSEIITSCMDHPNLAKKRRVEPKSSRSRKEILKQRIRNDQSLLDGSLRRAIPVNVTRTSNNTNVDQHADAFMTICNKIWFFGDIPENPPQPITSLTHSLSGSGRCVPATETSLKAHLDWVESSIRDRTAGWRSCVKLKVQFFAVFDESLINKEFADLICECQLHWELCATLEKYFRRHKADSIRMPLARFQVGCELLLAVFTNMEHLRTRLRDHLYLVSRSVCEKACEPLFGSWELWRMDVDSLLISTLNQLVATEDSLAVSVPLRTIESLVKISLIAPYQVVQKIVESAVSNRGQSSILLQSLSSLGQLAWLRTAPKEPTLLLVVLQHLVLNNMSEISPWSQTRQDNFTEFVLRAAQMANDVGLRLLDPIEFMAQCALPLLRDLTQGTEAGSAFRPVSKILMTIFSKELFSQSLEMDEASHHVVLDMLLQILRLRSLESSWSAGRIGSSLVARKARLRAGGEHLGDITQLGSAIIAYLTSSLTSDKDDIESSSFKRFLTQFEQDRNMDLESRLQAMPLLLACRDYLGLNVPFPSLPHDINILYRDRMAVLKCSKAGRVTEKVERVGGRMLARAILVALDLVRMSDEALDDILDAVIAADATFSTDLGDMKRMLAVSMNRILSISSRSEGQRLLTQAMPRLQSLWGGVRASDYDLFWESSKLMGSTSEKPEAHLGQYWEDYVQTTREGDGQGSKDIVGVMLMSETLLKLALDPYPEHKQQCALYVYEEDVGYDLQVDQLASILQSSIRALGVEWPEESLDKVLFCFMVACRMSYTVSALLVDRAFNGRIRPRTRPVAPGKSVLESAVMEVGEELEKEEMTARAKARDELVLMAMNFSEELVRRKDTYCKSLMGTMNRPRQNRQEKARGKGGRRGQSGHGRERSGQSQWSDQRGSTADLEKVADATSSNDGMDDGTRAWFKSVMAPLPKTVAEGVVGLETGKNIIDAVDEQPRQETAISEKDDIGIKEETASPMAAIKPMLTPDQRACLFVGLGYLPQQEQQAMRSRLDTLLQADENTSTLSLE